MGAYIWPQHGKSPVWLPVCGSRRWCGGSMPKNRPRCYCGGDTKRNGTTSKGTTRWRCKACGASVSKSRPDVAKEATFAQFIEHCTTTTSLSAVAKHNGVSTSTMKRRFSWCWLVDVPDPTIGHTGRIYDQVYRWALHHQWMLNRGRHHRPRHRLALVQTRNHPRV